MSKSSNPAIRLFHAVLAFDWYMYAVLLVLSAIMITAGMIFGLMLAADMPAMSPYFPLDA